ncbi:ATP-grasp domain-containing protein [Candidatus Woesearchaeota archaeon]|nr:ATP-grasp domain-containing protein [Candidatus Woesearchaeota archaeon]
MRDLKIGLLNKKRGNFELQEKFAGKDNVVDKTYEEIDHHSKALLEIGYKFAIINWGPDFISSLEKEKIDLAFNVSSMVEAAVLEELKIPYVGSDVYTIALSTNKEMAKRIWQQTGLPTSPFHTARSEEECRIFKENPLFDYPLFVKPMAGRGSSGIDSNSIVKNYEQLIYAVERIYNNMEQPALIEKFLRGKEITLGVLGNNDEARVLSSLEIICKKGDPVLTYEQKKLDDEEYIEYVCPAELSPAEKSMMESLALNAYHSLGFKDFGRIDTVLTKEGPSILEANTFAGLGCSPEKKDRSYIGFMAMEQGMDGKELLDKVIQIATKRYGSLLIPKPEIKPTPYAEEIVLTGEIPLKSLRTVEY